MNKIYVVAGTRAEYETYIRKKAHELHQQNQTTISLSHFVYVSDPYVLRGLREVHGYFVGSYRQRDDLKEIVDTIRIINKIAASDYVIPPLLLPQAGEMRMNNGLMEVYDGRKWCAL